MGILINSLINQILENVTDIVHEFILLLFQTVLMDLPNICETAALKPSRKAPAAFTKVVVKGLSIIQTFMISTAFALYISLCFSCALALHKEIHILNLNMKYGTTASLYAGSVLF